MENPKPPMQHFCPCLIFLLRWLLLPRFLRSCEGDFICDSFLKLKFPLQDNHQKLICCYFANTCFTLFFLLLVLTQLQKISFNTNKNKTIIKTEKQQIQKDSLLANFEWKKCYRKPFKHKALCLWRSSLFPRLTKQQSMARVVGTSTPGTVIWMNFKLGC